ncbi:unnamed protein product [Discosporangium mesarthrocarpum]
MNVEKIVNPKHANDALPTLKHTNAVSVAVAIFLGQCTWKKTAVLALHGRKDADEKLCSVCIICPRFCVTSLSLFMHSPPSSHGVPFFALQVAQQDSERSRYIVEKAKQEKMSIVIKAQGEAQSAKLVGDAIKDNPGFIKLRRIDAAKDIANMVSRSNNKLFLNTDSLLINLEAVNDDLSSKSNKKW